LIAAALVAGLACAVGCERTSEASRAALAERRESWSREIGGCNGQYAALEARLAGGAGTASRGGVAERRVRAVLEGTRQSIADVEIQLGQAAGRAEQAISRGREEGERAIETEGVNARASLQALNEQIGRTARQVDDYLLSASTPPRSTPTP
jgi:hypothetical protein